MTQAPAPAPSTSELDLRDITVKFGGLLALSEVSLSVAPNTVHAVIGPNGAGKTTLFNVACGFVRPTTGEVHRQGRTLTRLRPHDLAGHRMARTLQGLGLFDRMSVLDNVVAGAEVHARTGFFGTLLALPGSWREEQALRAKAMDTLRSLGVAEVADWYPPSLPYPVRKRVALARALVADPELLLLDEPASGLSAAEMTDLGDLIRELSTRMSVLLVEHHMDLVMRISDEITVLNFGKVIAHGSPAEVQQHPAVLQAYLGEAV